MRSPPKMPAEAARVRQVADFLMQSAARLEEGSLGAAYGDLDAAQRRLLDISFLVALALGEHKARCAR